MKLKPVTLADLTVTTSGTEVRVTTDTTILPVKIIFSGKATNTGHVLVGDSNVATTRGFTIAAGASVVLDADNYRGGGCAFQLSDFYVDAVTNGDIVKVTYFTRT